MIVFYSQVRTDLTNRNVLFFEEDLHAQLRARQLSISSKVDNVPQDQFLISSEQELIEHVVASLTVEPVVLLEEGKTMDQREAQVDVSRDQTRYLRPGRSGPFYIPGTQVEIDIPFTGEEWIFRYRPSIWSTVFPNADVRQGHLRITITQPHDADSSAFKVQYEREMKLIREYVDRSYTQVVAYNESLPNIAEQAIIGRRNRLSQHENIASLLDIPLATKPNVPSISPVKVEIRRPPSLPRPPKTGLVPEPGIRDESFEHILSFIRHQGRTFEQTPGTYAVHDEEDLRNIVLAQLNGHFRGEAVGEAFRGKGKTDICIEQDNRAAFVGECKLWTGPASIAAALNQLLGYLTWRDSKAALIVFNTLNKNFTNILQAMPSILQDHPLFLRGLPCKEAGEWRVQMRSEEDAGRRVMVHTFAFNLYQRRTSPSRSL